MAEPEHGLGGIGELVSAVSGAPAALDLLSRVLDAVPFGLALYDARDEEFRVLYANPAALRVSAGRNVVGLRFVDAFPTAEGNSTLDVFREVRSTGVARHFHEVTITSSDGTERTWNWTVYPILGVDGKVEQLIGVGQEVTELVLARTRLSEAADLSMAILLEVSRHSEAGLSIDEFFGRMATSIAELVRATRVVFSRYDTKDRVLRYQPMGYGITPAIARAMDGVPCRPGGEDLVSRIVFGTEVLLGGLDSLASEGGEFIASLQSAGLGNGAAIAWRAGDERLGLLAAFDSRRTSGFQREDVLILRAAGRASGLVWQRRRAELALEQRAAELEELDDLKSRFLRLASHELRAPLSVARGYISMVTDGSLDEARAASVLPIVEGKLGEMDRMVTQMIETARLEDSRMSLNRHLVSIREIVESAAASAAPFRSEDHELELVFPDHEVIVNADPARLENIIGNLVGNAFKYSPGGGLVTVRIWDGDGLVRVAVSDQGIGIRDEDRARLFTRFGRLDAPGTENVPGTGLGLYLSQELAKEHGGRIEVASTPGRGSTFTLVLPAETRTSGASSAVRSEGGRRGRQD